jgi:hypothetical protein
VTTSLVSAGALFVTAAIAYAIVKRASSPGSEPARASALPSAE